MGNQSSSISFHIVYNKLEAQTLLHEAEQKDFYLEECQDDPMNALARRKTAYSANGMTDREYKFFEVVVENARDKIPLRLQQDLKTVYLVQLMPSADGGMPHTRPDRIICYPDITQTFSFQTLIHELWHIHQRLFRDEWDHVFREMGWEEWKGRMPAHLDKTRRFNPDTLDTPYWCYQKTWVPIPVFRDIRQPNMTETDVWFYHVSLKYHVKSVPKEMEKEYGTVPWSAYEHPREMAAYLLSDPDRYGQCSGFEKLIRMMGALALPRESNVSPK
jgi:hypothetical protein